MNGSLTEKAASHHLYGNNYKEKITKWDIFCWESYIPQQTNRKIMHVQQIWVLTGSLWTSRHMNKTPSRRDGVAGKKKKKNELNIVYKERITVEICHLSFCLSWASSGLGQNHHQLQV